MITWTIIMIVAITAGLILVLSPLLGRRHGGLRLEDPQTVRERAERQRRDQLAAVEQADREQAAREAEWSAERERAREERARAQQRRRERKEQAERQARQRRWPRLERAWQALGYHTEHDTIGDWLIVEGQLEGQPLRALHQETLQDDPELPDEPCSYLAVGAPGLLEVADGYFGFTLGRCPWGKDLNPERGYRRRWLDIDTCEPAQIGALDARLGQVWQERVEADALATPVGLALGVERAVIVWEVERWPEDQGALERALDELVRETLALGARLGAVLEVSAAQAAVSLIGASGLLASSRVPAQVRQAPLDVLDADERELVDRVVRAGVASEHSWVVFETLAHFPERAGAALSRERTLELYSHNSDAESWPLLRQVMLSRQMVGALSEYVGQPSRRADLVRGLLERGAAPEVMLTRLLEGMPFDARQLTQGEAVRGEELEGVRAWCMDVRAVVEATRGAPASTDELPPEIIEVLEGLVSSPLLEDEHHDGLLPVLAWAIREREGREGVLRWSGLAAAWGGPLTLQHIVQQVLPDAQRQEARMYEPVIRTIHERCGGAGQLSLTEDAGVRGALSPAAGEAGGLQIAEEEPEQEG